MYSLCIYAVPYHYLERELMPKKEASSLIACHLEGSPKYCLYWHSKMTLRCIDVNATTTS